MYSKCNIIYHYT